MDKEQIKKMIDELDTTDGDIASKMNELKKTVLLNAALLAKMATDLREMVHDNDETNTVVEKEDYSGLKHNAACSAIVDSIYNRLKSGQRLTIKQIMKIYGVTNTYAQNRSHVVQRKRNIRSMKQDGVFTLYYNKQNGDAL